MKEDGCRHNIGAIIESAREEVCYKNYLMVRDCVLSMLCEDHGGTDLPSHYWEEELVGFDYLMDASPLIVRKLREHSYHITGLKSYEYRRHHAHKADAFRMKFAALKNLDDSDLFIPEARDMGGYGHEIDGDLINIDTLKFYESLIALNRAGVLRKIGHARDRPVVVEIGGGWGGFAYQFKKTCPNSTYVIVDLPQTMIFSGVYLKTIFPSARVFIYGEDGHTLPPRDITEYDFVFMPHYSVPSFSLPHIDLAINMVSFQEMTTDQVQGYVSWLFDNGCESLYSHNRARSAHNNQLSDVSVLLDKGFEMKQVTVLPVPYTVLDLPRPMAWSAEPKKMARQIIQRMAAPIKKAANSHLDYRHLIGSRRVSLLA